MMAERIAWRIFVGIMCMVVIAMIVAVGMSDTTVIEFSESHPEAAIPEPAEIPEAVIDVPEPIPEIPVPQEPEAVAVPEISPEEDTDEPELYLLKYWEGNGIKTTEPFVIVVSPWFIVWQSEPDIFDDVSMGIFQIMVYDIDEPDFPLTLAANTQDAGLDTSYIYHTGEFYLTINAANTKWNVSVFTESN